LEAIHEVAKQCYVSESYCRVRRRNVARHSGEVAESLILVGLILQVITFLVALGIGFYFLIIPWSVLNIPWLGDLVLFLAFLTLIWLILVYTFSYARTVHGDYEGASTPTLVFAIVSLISGAILSGILYIVAYVKLVDAADENETRRARPRPSTVPPVVSPSLGRPDALTDPSSPPAAISDPLLSPTATGSNFCTNCGRPTPPLN
jgi:hypothetical protein